MSPGDAALGYVSQGWAVLPCHEPTGSVGCSCRRVDCTSPGKHPRTRRGLHDATTDPDAVAAWWRRWPTANIGLRTGAASGLVVVDVDPAHGGEASLARLAAEHGPLPPTLTVSTGSGGRHLYYAHPGRPVRNSAGTLGPGLDLRGDGGYVVAPPSRHITGGTYRWLGNQSPAALPGWLEHPRPQPAPSPPDQAAFPRKGSTTSWANQALAGELSRVRHSEAGRRNNDLNRAAFALGQLIAGSHLDADVVYDLLVNAGLAIGLGAREVAATVRSGLAAGGRHPRHPADRQPDGEPTTGPAIDLRTVDLSPTPRTSRRNGRDIPGRSLP